MISRRSLIRTGAGVGATAALTVSTGGMVLAGAGSAAAAPSWDSLRAALTGTLVLPGESTYDQAIQLHQAKWDVIHPQAVAYCKSTGDVATCLRFAQNNSLAFSVRSGGHSNAGYSTTPGLVIDVSRLNSVRATGSTVRLGPGAQGVDITNTLSALGLQVISGTCPTVAMGGFLQGGGLGPASRKYGTAADRLVSARVVLADGKALTASANDNPDLFWALRGGGGGNFGIVTRFEARVHRVGAAARFSASFPSAGAALAAWEAWAPETDPRLTSVLQLGTGSATAVGQDLGSERRLAALLGPLRRAGASVSTGSASYGALQVHWGNGRTTPRTTFSAKSHYVRKRLPERVRDALLAELARGGAVAGLGTGMLILDAYGGALNRPRPGATAFVHRDARYSIQYLAYHDDGGAASRGWLRRMHGIVAPHADGAYQNYMDADLRGWRGEYYGRNLERLEQVRARYDPDRRFRCPRGI